MILYRMDTVFYPSDLPYCVDKTSLHTSKLMLYETAAFVTARQRVVADIVTDRIADVHPFI
jgi:hypothetical protein